MTPDQKLAFELGTRMMQIRRLLPPSWQLDVCLQAHGIAFVRLIDADGTDRYEEPHDIGEHPTMMLVLMGLDRCLEILEGL